MNNLGFYIYLLFVCSWFLHLTARIPALGFVRFDLVLLAILAVTAIANKSKDVDDAANETSKYLKLLVAFVIVTIPFVEWPGSVVRFGLQNFIKAIVFFYFTVCFVDSLKKLKTFFIFFIGCQLFRIVEPLYLHLTEGYWGSFATMSNWEALDRLSGAPHDIINPNGLAFVILTTLPFLHFHAGLGKWYKIGYIVLLPIVLYTLILTGSRSGFVGLLIIAAAIIYKSKNRFLVMTMAGLAAVVLALTLTSDLKDRYLSIVSSDTRNAATATGRIEGVMADFKVALHRPFFGHGLGTSREANANFGGIDQLSHNLYTETAQEIGFVGLAIFLLFIKSILKNFIESKKRLVLLCPEKYLINLLDALQVWLVMNVVFSFASFGLSGYSWYLFAGASVAVNKVIANDTTTNECKARASV